jgi:hypothetical protein
MIAAPTSVVTRESGWPSIPEVFEIKREAAAYWIARSKPGDDSFVCGAKRRLAMTI